MIIKVKTLLFPQVSSAQLEALRLENRLLQHSGSANHSDPDSLQLERHLQELQQTYTGVITTLEVWPDPADGFSTATFNC